MGKLAVLAVVYVCVMVAWKSFKSVSIPLGGVCDLSHFLVKLALTPTCEAKNTSSKEDSAVPTKVGFFPITNMDAYHTNLGCFSSQYIGRKVSRYIASQG